MNILQGKINVATASYGTVGILLGIASAFAMPMLFGILAIVAGLLAVQQGEWVHGAMALVIALYIGIVKGGMMGGGMMM